MVFPGKDYFLVLSKVRNRKRITNGLPIGDANINPILDSITYEFDSTDGIFK